MANHFLLSSPCRLKLNTCFLPDTEQIALFKLTRQRLGVMSTHVMDSNNATGGVEYLMPKNWELR